MSTNTRNRGETPVRPMPSITLDNGTTITVGSTWVDVINDRESVVGALAGGSVGFIDPNRRGYRWHLFADFIVQYRPVSEWPPSPDGSGS